MDKLKEVEFRDYIINHPKDTTVQEDDDELSVKPLSLNNFLGTFSIWFLGLGISIIVFVLELTVSPPKQTIVRRVNAKFSG